MSASLPVDLEMIDKWALPPRPKPGRKPAAAVEVKGTRETQRKFRERKQQYVTDLESKVRLLSSQDGEKAKLFQTEALRLKAENVRLSALVSFLHQQLTSKACSCASDYHPFKRRRIMETASQSTSADSRQDDDSLASFESASEAAFKGHLATAVCKTSPCSTCPSTSSSCHMNTTDCVDIEELGRRIESDVWPLLESHPNISSANLSMLADVVALETSCERVNDRQRRLTTSQTGVASARKILDGRDL